MPWGFPAPRPALGIHSSPTQLRGPSFLCFCRDSPSKPNQGELQLQSSGFLKAQLRGGAAPAIYRDGESSSHRVGQPGVGDSHLCLPSPISCVIRVLRGRLNWPGSLLLQAARAKQKSSCQSRVGEAMRQWAPPPQLGAGAQPAGRGDPLSSAPIPPPRLRRASSRKHPTYPRPTEPSLERASSKGQPGTPAASLCLADSPDQHRTMPPGPASRANVSGFCFLSVPGNGTERV